MSAGFKFADEIFWGTNGAFEAYLEALSSQAILRFGADDQLAAFLREEWRYFFTGAIVCLDEWLLSAEQRMRFVQLLDATTAELLREGTFTDFGIQWVIHVIGDLRQRIAGDGGVR